MQVTNHNNVKMSITLSMIEIMDIVISNYGCYRYLKIPFILMLLIAIELRGFL